MNKTMDEKISKRFLNENIEKHLQREMEACKSALQTITENQAQGSCCVAVSRTPEAGSLAKQRWKWVRLGGALGRGGLGSETGTFR